jgi:hypothetical protein
MGPKDPRGVWFGFPDLPGKRASDFFCSTRLSPENHTQSAKTLAGAAGAQEHVRVYSHNRKEYNSGTRYLHYDLLGSIACRSL